MNIALWIIQGILAIMFCISGIMILTRPKEMLAPQMPFVNDYADPMVKLVAFAHIFGAIGLILPLWLNIMPILTPIAASGLVLVMVLAIGYNKKRGDNRGVIVDMVILLLYLLIAVFRFKGL